MGGLASELAVGGAAGGIDASARVLRRDQRWKDAGRD